MYFTIIYGFVFYNYMYDEEINYFNKIVFKLYNICHTFDKGCFFYQYCEISILIIYLIYFENILSFIYLVFTNSLFAILFNNIMLHKVKFHFSNQNYNIVDIEWLIFLIIYIPEVIYPNYLIV